MPNVPLGPRYSAGFHSRQNPIYTELFTVISKGGEFGPYQQRRFGQNTGIYRTNRRPVWAILTVAGHSSCELCRYLDDVPPETPIRDVVDRCRVWESHADPEIRRVSKPGPDPIYPAYVIGDSDKVVEEIWVAAVSKPKSTSDQME